MFVINYYWDSFGLGYFHIHQSGQLVQAESFQLLQACNFSYSFADTPNTAIAWKPSIQQYNYWTKTTATGKKTTQFVIRLTSSDYEPLSLIRSTSNSKERQKLEQELPVNMIPGCHDLSADPNGTRKHSVTAFSSAVGRALRRGAPRTQAVRAEMCFSQFLNI